MNTRGNANVIDAMVPLANMFGYVNNLRSLTQGRANYSMQFDHYEVSFLLMLQKKLRPN